MNSLKAERKASVVAALVEGNSINATCRMTGVAKHTVLKLLKDLGCACAAYHDAHVCNLRVTNCTTTPVPNNSGVFTICFGKEQGKLVPMEMRYGIHLANSALHGFRYDFQNLVSCVVAASIIHFFETVQIEISNGEGTTEPM